jgi:hypothetical protein
MSAYGGGPYGGEGGGSGGPVRPAGIAPRGVGAPTVTGGAHTHFLHPTGIPDSSVVDDATIFISSLPPGPLPTPIALYIPSQRDNSRYKFVITDMLGNIVGEVLECSNKEFIQILDNMQVAKFTTKISNPMADYILQNDCLCKCYRQPVDRKRDYRLLLIGDVVTDEEETTNESGTITFTVVDPLDRLLWRMLGKGMDSNNHGIGFASGTPTVTKDIADIVGDMLLAVNADPVLGFTGVTMGVRGNHTPQSYLAQVY